jgi:hypothetical protein
MDADKLSVSPISDYKLFSVALKENPPTITPSSD